MPRVWKDRLRARGVRHQRSAFRKGLLLWWLRAHLEGERWTTTADGAFNQPTAEATDTSIRASSERLSEGATHAARHIRPALPGIEQLRNFDVTYLKELVRALSLVSQCLLRSAMNAIAS